MHGYFSMPLFVFPLTLLAYGALTYHSRVAGLPWPGRAFRRQHWLAGAIVVLFLVPIVIDMVTTHPSNVQVIIDHIRTSDAERKGALKSLLYFLHFGAYAAYPHSDPIPAFETFDFSGTVLFFRTHWLAYSLWLTVILLPPALLVRRKEPFSNLSAVAGNDAASRSKDLKAFLLWMYLVLGVATVLSLVWACIIEGPMFYYVSLFNFAIYYGFLLIFAIVAACWVERLLSPSSSYAGTWRRRVEFLGPVLLALVAFASFALEARRFRSNPPDQDQQRRSPRPSRQR